MGREMKTQIASDKKTRGKLLICDLPTTLTALFDAIEMYLSKGHTGKSKEQELLEARELSNFVAVVKAKVAGPLRQETGEIHRRITAIKRPGNRGQAYNRDREGKGVSSAFQRAGVIGSTQLQKLPKPAVDCLNPSKAGWSWGCISAVGF